MFGLWCLKFCKFSNIAWSINSSQSYRVEHSANLFHFLHLCVASLFSRPHHLFLMSMLSCTLQTVTSTANMKSEEKEMSVAKAATSALPQLDQSDSNQQQQQPARATASPSVPKQGFPNFALLPAEIRNIVWKEALEVVPRVHFLITQNHALPHGMLPA